MLRLLHLVHLAKVLCQSGGKGDSHPVDVFLLSVATALGLALFLVPLHALKTGVFQVWSHRPPLTLAEQRGPFYFATLVCFACGTFLLQYAFRVFKHILQTLGL